jgi:hypothetical protein
MNDFTASKFRVGIEIISCNHDPCNDICYDCEEKNRLIRIEAKLDRLLAIVDKPKVKRKVKSARSLDEVRLDQSAFESWWYLYPVGHKKGKTECFKIWLAKGLTSKQGRLTGDMAHRVKNDGLWLQGIGIPHPKTFLNGERWNDDITPIVQKVEALPRDNTKLMSWAAEHGYPDPFKAETYVAYRGRLQTIHNGAQT